MRPAFLAALGVTLSCAARISPDEHGRLAIVRSVGFAPDSGASSEIRNDCRLGEELVEAIERKARRHLTVRLVSDHRGVSGRVIVMRFSRVDADSEVVALMGRLLEDGEVVSWFTAQRSSASGEICELLGDIVDDLADDVAKWLREPTRDAMLGEM